MSRRKPGARPDTQPLAWGGGMNHIFVYNCYHFIDKYTKMAYKWYMQWESVGGRTALIISAARKSQGQGSDFLTGWYH